MKKKYVLFILLIIVVVAIFLRVYHLPSQGFLLWDEGMYMNEAVFYESIIENTPYIIRGAFTGTLSGDTLIERIHGWFPSSGKPLHSFIVYLFSLIFGMKVFSAQLVSASFGIASLIMVYILTRELYDETIALIAAGLLCVSGYHIFMSRIGTPETDSAFFFLLGWYWYWKSLSQTKMKFVVLAGFALSICFAICYRWIVIIALLWGIELIASLMKKDMLKKGVQRLCVLSVSFCILPIFIDIPYEVIQKVGGVSISFSHLPQNVFTYFDQVMHLLFSQSKYGTLSPHAFYSDALIYFNGIVVTSVMYIGVCLMVWRRRIKDALIVLPPVVLFILLSMKTRGNMLRYFSLALPFLSICAAYGFVWIFRFLRVRKIVKIISVSCVCLAVAYTNISSVRALLSVTSGYDNMMRVLEKHDGRKHLACMNSVSEFFVGRNVADMIPREKEELIAALSGTEYKCVVLDFLAHRIMDPDLRMLIQSNGRAVARIANPIGSIPYIIVESLGVNHADKSYFNGALTDPFSRFITIYDSEDVLSLLQT